MSQVTPPMIVHQCMQVMITCAIVLPRIRLAANGRLGRHLQVMVSRVVKLCCPSPSLSCSGRG